MPNLKTLTKELRQEIVSYLYPLPSISSNLAFRLAIHIFTKTRFSSHINFISRCLQHKVIPKGFRSNFHASIFSNVSNFNLKYLHEIQRTQNTFSHNIMRSTIRAMCSKRNELNKQIIECRSQLSNVCPSVLLRSIHAKIQALNSKLFHHLEQTKKHKLENLTNSPKNRTEPLENQNHHTVVTIPENLPLSNAEKSVLSKGLNFVPISKKSDEFTTREDVEKFLRRVQLKAFFHNKEDKSDNTKKDAFETLTAKKSKWTPPEGQFASIDYFIKKCRHDVHKLKSNCNTKLSNLSKEEWTALINLKNRKDLVIVSRNGLLLCVQFVFTTLNNSLLFLVPVRELSRELRVINYNLRKIVGMTNLLFRGEGFGSCALKVYEHRSTHGRQKRLIVRLFHAPAN